MRIEPAISDLFKNFLVLGAVERRISTEKDKEDDADTPDITFVIVLAPKYLWGYIIDGAKAL